MVRNDHRAGLAGPVRAHGFTLIEILVVLVIIGVALTFATLSINPTGAGDRLNTEAQRLVALMRTAADQAILSGDTLGLELTRDGYRFVALDESGWQVLGADGSSLRPRQLPADIYLDQRTAAGRGDDRQSRLQTATLTLPPSPVPPTPGQAREQAEARAAARDNNAELPIPAALFLSSGELLPFTLEVSARDVDHRFVIHGTAGGEIDVERVDR